MGYSGYATCNGRLGMHFSQKSDRNSWLGRRTFRCYYTGSESTKFKWLNI